MKYLPFAGKAITLLFTAALLVACSGSSKQAEEDAAEAARLAAQQAEQQANAAATAAATEQQRLRDAVASYGNVFYFDYDSYNLKPEATVALDAHIASLQGNQDAVRLEGHTDERGTREYNMALGERRANAVRDYMVLNGIANHRIETVSYGEERALAYGSSESNWSQNRRVEIK